MGVVVRRYIDFRILLIPTPLVSVLFAAASLLFVNIFRSLSDLNSDNVMFSLFYRWTNTDPAIVAILWSKQQTLDQIASIQSQRNAKQKATFRTKYDTRQNFDALLELPLDFHQYV